MKHPIPYFLIILITLLLTGCPERPSDQPDSTADQPEPVINTGQENESDNDEQAECAPPLDDDGSRFLIHIAEGDRFVYGYLHKSGGIIIEPEYNLARDFSENLAAVQTATGDIPSLKWGFIDLYGNIVIEPEYPEVGDFMNGYAWVELPGDHDSGQSFGFINTDGQLVIAGNWEASSGFAEGLAFVTGPDEQGFITTSGEMVLPTEIMFSAFSDGRALGYGAGEYSYIDTTGNVIYSGRFDRAGNFSDGLALIMNDDLVGYINPAGEYVIEPVYNEGTDFTDGYAIVFKRETDTWCVIDTSGREILETSELPRTEFTENMLGVSPSMDMPIGFINMDGEVLIPHAYSQAREFHNGLAKVGTQDGYGYIDTDGNRVWWREHTWAH